MMHEDNPLRVRGRALIATTDFHHLPVYPNWARDLEPVAINQLWIADITYIRLRQESIYLSVVLDAVSRRVIGWARRDGRWKPKMAVAALRMAVVERQPLPGLVHHSDRGVQHASLDYTEMLKQRGVAISMCRKGNPYENAAANLHEDAET